MQRFWAPLLIIVVGVVSVYLWADLFRFARQPSVPALQQLGTLPAFDLTERRQLRLDDLRGKVWVADFMTRARNMSAAERRNGALADGVRRPPGPAPGSISVDPERDTPAVLSAYR